jgi:hypothetical protein
VGRSFDERPGEPSADYQFDCSDADRPAPMSK